MTLTKNFEKPNAVKAQELIDLFEPAVENSALSKQRSFVTVEDKRHGTFTARGHIGNSLVIGKAGDEQFTYHLMRNVGEGPKITPVDHYPVLAGRNQPATEESPIDQQTMKAVLNDFIAQEGPKIEAAHAKLVQGIKLATVLSVGTAVAGLAGWAFFGGENMAETGAYDSYSESTPE